MHTPASEYVAFWLAFAFIMACAWPWLFCAIVALGGMEQRTWRRILYAVFLGPFALGDVMARRW